MTFVTHFGQSSIGIVPQLLLLRLQLLDLVLERLDIVLGLLIRLLGGAPDLVQQCGPVPLKVFVIKADKTGRPGIHVRRQNGIGAQFAKAVKVQLTGKTGKVGMFEIKG